MSYSPTTWSTGDTITASAMNKIENGIANAGGGVSGLCTVTSGTMDKSYNDLLGMLNNGVVPYIVDVDGDVTRICVLFDVMIDGNYFADFYAKEGDTMYSYESLTADGYLTIVE